MCHNSLDQVNLLEPDLTNVTTVEFIRLAVEATLE